MNSTVASSILTSTQSSLTNTTLNSNYSTIGTGSNIWNATYNFTIYPPWYDNFTINIPTLPTITVTTYNWDGYYSYIIVVCILLICLAISQLAIRHRRQLMAREAALRRARARQRACNNNNANNNNQSGGNVVIELPQQPKNDLPPAYNEVMQTYLNEKQRLEMESQQGAVGGMPTVNSTATIETVISTNNSAVDLTTTTVVMSNPPPYQSSI
ncbi:uncharacterized protein LOC119684194 isoform X1 [Teleopsis dalmanni]|uniref:uncharacterized protein LOC119684194 isoform X1 n=1 Tax=Teleopsis dalmanni TaxID=139649 RepID=UPI0018CCCAF6|nr:uncharacterized protein LOC119684194 isoform X1 [Teleopsis dalmanni]